MTTNAKCRLCRRSAQKLFLKGSRCDTPKCAIVKKNYVPGAHGLKRQTRLSTYGVQLRAKQAFKYSYGLNETQLANLANKSKNFDEILGQLEMRLDNICFRLALFPSRKTARQAVLHGKVMVNEKKVTYPSMTVKVSDKISIKGKFEVQSKDLPTWLKLDNKKGVGEIIEKPDLGLLKNDLDADLIMEFYSH